ncbi:hypothetical protein [Rheinheimera texasensis]|uniref:hypothetical protein n=1 Tax=Rheinheimera texasensis TaxID=306205 RepID=UPI0032B27D09
MSRISLAAVWFLLLLPMAGCQAQDHNPATAANNLQQKPANFVYINGTKYRLIQRYPSYWLLIDPQNAQPLHLTNQLVVSGMKSVDELRKRLTIKPVLEVKRIAEGVLAISGTIAELMQLEQQLQQLADVRTEWQLYYLPLKSQPDR